jgi:hypothetical protein
MSGAASEFSKLDHRVPLARADVNRVGSGWSDPRVDRRDAVTHPALYVPGRGELPPAAEPPPPPPPPVLSEAERREQLAQAIAARDAAAASMQVAIERHDRAVRDEARCRTALAGYATLPAEIGVSKENALRAGSDASLPDGLRTRLQERGAAEADLAAAQRAVETFARERQQATEAYTAAAGWRLTKALREVIDVGRDRLRPELEATEQRAAALRQVIHRSRPWASVAEALLLDPLNAPLDVTVPDVPEADPPPQPLVPPPPPDEVRLMRQVGDPGPVEVVTMAELAARAKAERASPVSAAMREMEAVEQSRRGGSAR